MHTEPSVQDQRQVRERNPQISSLIFFVSFLSSPILYSISNCNSKRFEVEDDFLDAVLNLESHVGRGGIGVVGPGGKRRIVNPMCNVNKVISLALCYLMTLRPLLSSNENCLLFCFQAIDEDSILDDLKSMVYYVTIYFSCVTSLL